MSTFPPFAKCYRSGADAPSAASPDGVNAQSAGAGAAALAANSTEHKEHRFDKFARRIGASILDAIRVTLSVFSSPDKERWPAVRLLEFLKGAEDLARDMLREIAEKIFVYPSPDRVVGERAIAAPSEFREMRAPYFRLGVKPEGEATPGRSPERSEPEGRTSNAQAQVPGEAGTAPSMDEKTLPSGRGRDDKDENEPQFSRRLHALEDVLQHPGKHAARMARALYRAANGDGARLTARSYTELMLDHGDFLASDPAYASSEAARRMQQLFIDPG